MVKDKANHFLKIFITLCLVLLASCRTLCQNPQYDNLSFGIPGKADAIIDRPGYARRKIFSVFKKMGKTEIFSQINEAVTMID